MRAAARGARGLAPRTPSGGDLPACRCRCNRMNSSQTSGGRTDGPKAAMTRRRRFSVVPWRVVTHTGICDRQPTTSALAQPWRLRHERAAHTSDDLRQPLSQRSCPQGVRRGRGAHQCGGGLGTQRCRSPPRPCSRPWGSSVAGDGGESEASSGPRAVPALRGDAAPSRALLRRSVQVHDVRVP